MAAKKQPKPKKRKSLAARLKEELASVRQELAEAEKARESMEASRNRSWDESRKVERERDQLKRDLESATYNHDRMRDSLAREQSAHAELKGKIDGMSEAFKICLTTVGNSARR